MNAKTRLQVQRATECKRYMAARGKTLVSEIMTSFRQAERVRARVEDRWDQENAVE